MRILLEITSVPAKLDMKENNARKVYRNSNMLDTVSDGQPYYISFPAKEYILV